MGVPTADESPQSVLVTKEVVRGTPDGNDDVAAGWRAFLCQLQRTYT